MLRKGRNKAKKGAFKKGKREGKKRRKKNFAILQNDWSSDLKT